jgi:hypothetical protein
LVRGNFKRNLAARTGQTSLVLDVDAPEALTALTEQDGLLPATRQSEAGRALQHGLERVDVVEVQNRLPPPISSAGRRSDHVGVVRILLTVVSSQLASDRKRFTEWTTRGIVEFIAYALAAKSPTSPTLCTLRPARIDAFNASAFSMDAPRIIYGRLHFPGRSERRREDQSGSYPFTHASPLCDIFLISTSTKPQRFTFLYPQYLG